MATDFIKGHWATLTKIINVHTFDQAVQLLGIYATAMQMPDIPSELLEH